MKLTTNQSKVAIVVAAGTAIGLITYAVIRKNRNNKVKTAIRDRIEEQPYISSSGSSTALNAYKDVLKEPDKFLQQFPSRSGNQKINIPKSSSLQKKYADILYAMYGYGLISSWGTDYAKIEETIDSCEDKVSVALLAKYYKTNIKNVRYAFTEPKSTLLDALNEELSSEEVKDLSQIIKNKPEFTLSSKQAPNAEQRSVLNPLNDFVIGELISSDPNFKTYGVLSKDGAGISLSGDVNGKRSRMTWYSGGSFLLEKKQGDAYFTVAKGVWSGKGGNTLKPKNSEGKILTEQTVTAGTASQAGKKLAEKYIK